MGEHCELFWCTDPAPCADGDPACMVPPECGGSCVPDTIEPPPPPPLEPCANDGECGAFQYCAFPMCIRGEECPTLGLCVDLDPGTPSPA